MQLRWNQTGLDHQIFNQHLDEGSLRLLPVYWVPSPVIYIYDTMYLCIYIYIKKTMCVYIYIYLNIYKSVQALLLFSPTTCSAICTVDGGEGRLLAHHLCRQFMSPFITCCSTRGRCHHSRELPSAIGWATRAGCT